MKLSNLLFWKKKSNHSFTVEQEDDGDIFAIFTGNKLTYLVSLECDKRGILDVEFGVENRTVYDTTNAHEQYMVLNTVAEIIKHSIKTFNLDVRALAFKSSEYRNGNVDDRSRRIRDEFFLRFIKREYSNVTRDDYIDMWGNKITLIYLK